MDRRHNPRVEVQLPVQVWGLDAYGQAFMDPAIVTNVSTGGLVVQGLRRKVRAGEILDIRMGSDKAQYRVVWIAGPGSRQAGEVGMQKVTTHAFMADSVFACCSQAAGTC
jgi:hypothetical protein